MPKVVVRIDREPVEGTRSPCAFRLRAYEVRSTNGPDDLTNSGKENSTSTGESPAGSLAT